MGCSSSQDKNNFRKHTNPPDIIDTEQNFNELEEANFQKLTTKMEKIMYRLSCLKKRAEKYRDNKSADQLEW